MRKRTLALAFLSFVAVLVAATVAVLQTSWAGERLCALASSRLASLAGQPVRVGACRIRPLALSVELEGLEVGPAGAPLVAVDRIAARLAAVQTPGRHLRLASLQVIRPRVRVTVPAGPSGGGCSTSGLDRVEVRRLDLEEGSLDLAWASGARLSVARADVHTQPASGRLRELAGPLRRERVAATIAGVRLVAGQRDLHSSRLAVTADVPLDLSSAEIRALEGDLQGISVSASGRVIDLCRPRLDVAARANGGMAELFEIIGVGIDTGGRFKGEGRVTGPAGSPLAVASVELSGARIGPFTAGDGRVNVRVTDHDVLLDHLALQMGAGTAGGKVTIGFRSPVPLAAEMELHGVDLGDLLDRFGIGGAWVSTRLDGRARLAGTLDPPVVAGTISVEPRAFRVLTRSYVVGASDPGVLAFDRGRLEAPIRIDRDGLAFERATLEVGRGKVSIDSQVSFQTERGFSLGVHGDVDLDALGRVSSVPWRGLARLDLAGGAAPYGNPRISGRVKVQGFRFLDLDLGDVSADLRYDDFLLRLSDADGLRGQTRWKADAVLDLARSPPHVVSARYEAKGRLRDLFEAVMDYRPGARSVRDVLDAEAEVSGTATGPTDALDAEFDARLGAGVLAGRPFDSGRALGRVHRGKEVRIDQAELRRGDGRAQLAGAWGFGAPSPWDLTASWAGWKLSDLALPGGAWAGTASGTARLEGSLEVPRVHVAAAATGASLAGLALGEVQAGATVNGDRLVVTGGAEGLRFEGDARLVGKGPFRARAEVSLEDSTRLSPSAPGGPVRVTLRGEGSAEGNLAELLLASARVRLDAVQMAWADVKVQADAPAVLEASKAKVDLAPVTFRGTDTAVTISGSRLASGELDASVDGVVDVRLLSGLVPMLKRPSGRLELTAHVGGTLDAPLLVGSGRVADVAFGTRATNASVSALRGDLAFSQNRILFDGLEASVNGGRARLEGEVELSRLVPSHLRVQADLDEVPLAVPAYLPATLSGRIEATGTPDATILGGRLHVVRARYTADVGLESAVLELRRRPAPPPRPYDKSGEWVRLDLQLVVDGDARVENDLVRGAVRGELLLTGTLAAPGLLGNLSMTEGSRAVFRGNEFELSHAVMEFTGRNKVEAQVDVHGESQVRDYQVFMHVYGPLADPQLTLTSSPALSQPDIITLLSLGFTSRDTATGDSMNAMATAAAAQALVSASGLDEQVRRFVPRGGNLVRDLSMRITSAYSEGTGQVEPRAEFESWLLKDRLRLRYQAPLGTARGQRAQAELRLGQHTAVQYQWENDNPDVAAGDHGLDLKLRWEWNDR